MKTSLDCVECILRQALSAARFATQDPHLQRRILDEVALRLPEVDQEKSPAASSLIAYDLTARISDNPDPYAGAKKEQNRMAMAYAQELRELVRQSDDPLGAALHLAAAGNIMDLGTMKADEINLRTTVEETMLQGFAIDHSEELRESLAHCQDLLFLLDNAGEIVFDKILIEELQRYTKVTAVVKAGPILNDALLEDAQAVGLTEQCEVIDNGGAFIGSPLELVPASFLDRMEQADIIIGKGQGNYETVETFSGNVFLILRAKCDIIAEHMGVRHSQVALISTQRRNQERSAAAYSTANKASKTPAST